MSWTSESHRRLIPFALPTSSLAVEFRAKGWVLGGSASGPESACGGCVAANPRYEEVLDPALLKSTVPAAIMRAARAGASDDSDDEGGNAGFADYWASQAAQPAEASGEEEDEEDEFGVEDYSKYGDLDGDGDGDEGGEEEMDKYAYYAAKYGVDDDDDDDDGGAGAGTPSAAATAAAAAEDWNEEAVDEWGGGGGKQAQAQEAAPEIVWPSGGVRWVVFGAAGAAGMPSKPVDRHGALELVADGTLSNDDSCMCFFKGVADWTPFEEARESLGL